MSKAYRYRTFLAALGAVFLAVVLGLGVAVVLGVWWGLATAAILIVSIAWLSYKAFSGATPATRVMSAALQVLATGFTVSIAAHPLRDWLAASAASWLSKQGIPLAEFPAQPDTLAYFVVLAAAVVACVVAYLAFGQDKEVIHDSVAVGAAPLSAAIGSPIAVATNPDRVRPRLPSRHAIIAGLISTIILVVGLPVADEWVREPQDPNVPSRSVLPRAICVIEFVFALVCFLCLVNIGRAYWDSERCVRERVTFWAVPMILSSVILLLLMLAVSVSPMVGAYKLTTAAHEWPGLARWESRLLLVEIILWVVAPVLILRHATTRWEGLKSEEQYRAEDRKAESRWISECIRAWQWAWADELWVQVHRIVPAAFVSPLRAPPDPVAWPRRGFELVRFQRRELDLVDPVHFVYAACWLGKQRGSQAGMAVVATPPGDLESHLAHLTQYLPPILRGANPKIEHLYVVTDSPVVGAPGGLLGLPVEWLTEGDLIDTLVDFRGYIKDVREKVEVDQMPNSKRTLHQIYVPSAILHPDGRMDADVEVYLEQWLAEPSQRHVALLGDYGMGKSTAALMWTYRLLTQRGFDGQRLPPGFRVPILIPLRGFSPRHMAAETLLAEWARQYHIDPHAVRHLLAAGRAVVIFEGFDETAFQGNEDARIAHCRTLWELAYARSKLLFTGRPNFFANQTEREKALRLGEAGGNRPYCTAITLCGLDQRRLSLALRDQVPVLRDGILARASTHERFRELVSRPSLLHAVVTVWEVERLDQLQDDRLTSAKVIGLFIRMSDRREDVKEADDTPYKPVLTREERFYFMSGIASHMLANKLPNQISGNELVQLVDRLYEAIPVAISPPHDSLRQRVGDDPDMRNGMYTDVRTTGLLVHDESRSSAFKFSHKSFMEYLAGEQVAIIKVDPLNFSSGAIRYVTRISMSHLQEEPEATLFCAEVLVDRIAETGVQIPAQGILLSQQLNHIINGNRMGIQIYHYKLRDTIYNQELLDNPIYLIEMKYITRIISNLFMPTSHPFAVYYMAGVILISRHQSFSYILWLIACRRANIELSDIARSVGIRGQISCSYMPLIHLDIRTIQLLVSDIISSLYRQINIIISNPIDTISIIPYTVSFEEFLSVCEPIFPSILRAALPTPPELYLVKKQLHLEAAIVVVRAALEARTQVSPSDATA